MIIISSLLFGALLGALRARQRKGKALDIAQYAAAHAIAFGLLGLVVTIIIERSGRVE